MGKRIPQNGNKSSKIDLKIEHILCPNSNLIDFESYFGWFMSCECISIDYQSDPHVIEGIEWRQNDEIMSFEAF